MKKSAILLVILMVLGIMAYAETGESTGTMTFEDLEEIFALKVDAEGMTADELLEEGHKYETGDGAKQWFSMAMAYYKMAAEAGNEAANEAITNLEAYRQEFLDNSPEGEGEMYTWYRTGVTAGQSGDYETAYIVCYDDAFFFNDPLMRGIGDLGDLLLKGLGTDQDVEKALEIYNFRATTGGNGKGYSSLGMVYQAEDGTYPGITHSNDTAMKYFLLSYDRDAVATIDNKGPRYVGNFYNSGYTKDDGTVVEPDYVKAAEYYSIGADGSLGGVDSTSCYMLGTYYAEGREGIEQDYAKAAEYFQMGVADEHTHSTILGVPQTYLSLGRFFEEGLGVDQDLEKAAGYYEKARDTALDNLALVNAAGNDGTMQSIHDEAVAALERLGQSE